MLNLWIGCDCNIFLHSELVLVSLLHRFVRVGDVSARDEAVYLRFHELILPLALRSGRRDDGIDLFVEVAWLRILCERVDELLVRGGGIGFPCFGGCLLPLTILRDLIDKRGM